MSGTLCLIFIARDALVKLIQQKERKTTLPSTAMRIILKLKIFKNIQQFCSGFT